MKLDVKASAVPRAGWPAAFEQRGMPKGRTGPAEAMYEAINAGWMNLGVAGTEHVPGVTSAREVFAAAKKAGCYTVGRRISDGMRLSKPAPEIGILSPL